MSLQDDESPRDERFYTPRAQAASARSWSSYGTPRCGVSSSASDSEYITPRFNSDQNTQQLEQRPNLPRPLSKSYTRTRRPCNTFMQQKDKDTNYQGQISNASEILSLARHNRVDQLEQFLIKGVCPDIEDENGNTILSVACQNGNKRIVKLALRYGADMNKCNVRGNTALHFCFK